MKYSNNKKTNAVLSAIEKQLLSIHSTKEESMKEILHYYQNFPKEIDYNLAQYGNLLFYYDDVRRLYRSFKSLKKASNNKIWEIYKRQVGYVARILMKK